MPTRHRVLLVCMQVTRRTDEMRKCSSVETTGRGLCMALMANQERYEQCMAAHDIKVGECKFKIETEMRKCEEELSCKVCRGWGGGRGEWPPGGMCACMCGFHGLMAKTTHS